METIHKTLRPIDLQPFIEAPPTSTHYQTFSYQLENSDPHKPCEDAQPLFYEIDQGVYFGGIFDGITRSKRSDGTYPNPSPARMAADKLEQITQPVFRQELNETLRASQNPDYTTALRNTLKELNGQLREFNGASGFTKETVDYGERDMPGASVLLSVIDGQTLHVAMIADCNAYVFGHDGGQLLTPVQTDVKDVYGKYLKAHDPNFNHESWRKYYRKEFRNQKDVAVEMDRKVIKPGYGALTGESGAPDFIVTMYVPLDPDAIVLIASDGSLSVPIDEMNDILRRRITQEKPQMILPEIFGRAQDRANVKGKHSDDRTGILYIPDQYFPT